MPQQEPSRGKMKQEWKSVSSRTKSQVCQWVLHSGTAKSPQCLSVHPDPRQYGARAGATLYVGDAMSVNSSQPGNFRLPIPGGMNQSCRQNRQSSRTTASNCRRPSICAARRRMTLGLNSPLFQNRPVAKPPAPQAAREMTPVPSPLHGAAKSPTRSVSSECLSE